MIEHILPKHQAVNLVRYFVDHRRKNLDKLFSTFLYETFNVIELEWLHEDLRVCTETKEELVFLLLHV